MREIRSPLDGILSPFAAKPPADAYAVQGLSPLLVADFTTPYYRKAGAVSTFDSTFTHSRAGEATMVDSDGLIKWAPHNLALNSAAPATQSITVVSGADYTVEITGSGSVALTGAGTGTVTAGNPVEITASTTTLTLTVTGTPSTMWAYRSDLGGMVNNPDTGTSYVPTTSAAVYQARRNHYTYNGISWVNSGLLLETEARTNLIQYSEDFTDASWVPNDTGTLLTNATGPDGETSATTLVDSNASGTGIVLVYVERTVLSATAHTFSIFAKADQLSWLILRNTTWTNLADSQTSFNLSNGTIGTTAAVHTATIQDFENGWYRCSITFTPDAVDLTGRIQVVCGGADNNTTVDLDGTSSILIYGAQFEKGSTPSSYMPNYGTAAGTTRPTESLQIAAADMPWPTPNVIGTEAVTNPGDPFLSTTGYSAGGAATLSVDTDRLKVSQTTGYTDGVFTVLASDIFLQPTVVSFDVDFGSASLVQVQAGNGTFGNGSIFTINFFSSGTYNIVTAAGFGGSAGLSFKASSAADFFLSRVSVREIDPLSVSLQMQGKMTYADINDYKPYFHRWYADSNTYIQAALNTTSTSTGNPRFFQNDASYTVVQLGSNDAYSPDILVPYNIVSRHGSTFVNGAVDGTADTADTTPTALPDLSATDFSLGYDYMGTIGLFRAWNVDIGDTGIEDATS